jgi:peptidoglycan/LPS O-acetylase OafA/YrhL
VSENLAALAGNRDNNFRIIRLAAASAVIFSHAYVVNMGLSQATWFKEPLYAWTGVSFGDLAVNIFFVTSGFLVSHGLIGSGRFLDFVMARVLRIYPGLIVALLFCAFALGPIATNLGLRHYLAAKGTWAFILYDGLALAPLSLRAGLPGVFAHNPYPDVVNASLWTLPWEVWMYISLLVVAGLRLAGRIFPALLAVILILYALSEFGFGHSSTVFPTATRFLAFFYVGVAFYRYRGLVPISPKAALVVAAVFLVGSVAIQNRALEPVFVGYMTLFAAYWPRGVIKRWSHGADISYGIYIYAYPVQQTWVWLLGSHNVLLNCALTFPVTAALAFASWVLVEKPALDLKARLRAHRSPPPTKVIATAT